MTHTPTPVVLIHGLRVSGASLHRIAAAIPGRTVVTPDLPGHGARAGETFSIDAAVATILEVIDDLGTPAVVAGMSLGGYVAMATAGRAPEMIAGLVPMCSTAQPNRMLAFPFRMLGAVTAVMPKEAALISRGLTNVALGRRVSRDMEAGGLSLHSIRDVADELSHFDALDALRRYPGPVAFISGGWDQFRIHEKQFAAAATDSELIVLPRAMHLFPLIQPHRTGKLIGEFALRVDGRRTQSSSSATSSH